MASTKVRSKKSAKGKNHASKTRAAAAKKARSRTAAKNAPSARKSESAKKAEAARKEALKKEAAKKAAAKAKSAAKLAAEKEKKAQEAKIKAEKAKRKRLEEQKKTEAAKRAATPVGQTTRPAAPVAKASLASPAHGAAKAQVAKPAASPPAAPASQPTAQNERIDVTKKKTSTAAVPAAAPLVAPTPQPPVSKAVAGPPPALRPAAVKPAETKPVAKSGVHRTGFKAQEFIVYPAHGVGQIVAIEEQEVAGFKLELFVINFVKDKMTLKVPLPKVVAGAIRKLAEPDVVKKALDTLTGRARIKRTMWSRRAQEYEAKINSGDLGSIAEVVRDLYRSDAQPEQSYSERQLYEAALDRMGREIAVVQKLAETEALKLIESQLQRGPRRGGKADVEADAEAAVEVEGDIEQAA